MSKWLKADLHIHTNQDKEDYFLKYDAKQLIDEAAKYNYDVLAFTFHNQKFDGKEFEDAKKYAAKKGILIIPGCEAMIENKDVLIYNITEDERKKIKSFKDLRKWKLQKEKAGRQVLVTAAHPYLVIPLCNRSLNEKLEENIDIFDAIEYHFFYLKYFFNPNKKSEKIAKKHNKPMVGDGDVHMFGEMNLTYSLINSKKTVDDVIKAIKAGKVKVVTRPCPFWHFFRTGFFHIRFNLPVIQKFFK